LFRHRERSEAIQCHEVDCRGAPRLAMTALVSRQKIQAPATKPMTAQIQSRTSMFLMMLFMRASLCIADIIH
jgi:hypothetical protein